MQVFFVCVLAKLKMIGKVPGDHIAQVELLIDESCIHLIADLEGVKLGPKGKEKKRVKDKDTGVSFEKYGHLTDCLFPQRSTPHLSWPY